MKVLVLGATGMLGHKLCQRLVARFDVTGTVRRPGDIVIPELDAIDLASGVDATNFASVRKAISDIKPEVVINAIGVIKQASNATDAANMAAVNSVFPHKLAEMTAEVGFRLMHISTDCVFGGRKGMYAEEDASDATDLYGTSKRAGEPAGENVLTLRTSIIGHEIGTTHGLLEWFLSQRGGEAKGFTNAIFSGLPTVVLADVIGDVIQDHPALTGIYHVASAPISKYDLLSLINEAFGANVSITPSDEISIDRSLDGRRFAAATGFKAAPWPELIALMAEDAQKAATRVS